MIEVPAAALGARHVLAPVDFGSLGTNDLTQTTFAISRDDAEGKFLTYYIEHGILERNPFEVLDEDGVGDLMRIAVERGRGAKPEIKLGILPGAGGTQRLPRLTGAKYALDAILSGRHIPAPEAKSRGIIDALSAFHAENPDLPGMGRERLQLNSSRQADPFDDGDVEPVARGRDESSGLFDQDLS